MPDEVGFKEESSAARLTLVVPVTMVHVPLMQQVALLTRELRRTLRTSENTHTEPVSHFFWIKRGKRKGSSICIVFPHEASLKRSGIACIVKGFHSFTCTPCI